MPRKLIERLYSMSGMFNEQGRYSQSRESQPVAFSASRPMR